MSVQGSSVVSLYVDSCRQLQLGKQGTPYARCEIKVRNYLPSFVGFEILSEFWLNLSQLRLLSLDFKFDQNSNWISLTCVFFRWIWYLIRILSLSWASVGFDIWSEFLLTLSNTYFQLGSADSLRSSKKPLPSEGLSIFVVNLNPHICPLFFCWSCRVHISLQFSCPCNFDIFVKTFCQTKPRSGEHPVFEEGFNFVCRNLQTNALSIQVRLFGSIYLAGIPYPEST